MHESASVGVEEGKEKEEEEEGLAGQDLQTVRTFIAPYCLVSSPNFCFLFCFFFAVFVSVVARQKSRSEQSTNP